MCKGVKANINKIDYNNLSFNYYEEVIHLLKPNLAKINWFGLSQSPFIFLKKKNDLNL
jgi:hypothetical protein